MERAAVPPTPGPVVHWLRRSKPAPDCRSVPVKLAQDPTPAPPASPAPAGPGNSLEIEGPSGGRGLQGWPLGVTCGRLVASVGWAPARCHRTAVVLYQCEVEGGARPGQRPWAPGLSLPPASAGGDKAPETSARFVMTEAGSLFSLLPPESLVPTPRHTCCPKRLRLPGGLHLCGCQSWNLLLGLGSWLIRLGCLPQGSHHCSPAVSTPAGFYRGSGEGETLASPPLRVVSKPPRWAFTFTKDSLQNLASSIE